LAQKSSPEKGGFFVALSLSSIADPWMGFQGFRGEMKLNLIFFLFDILILMIYPIAFFVGKMRQIFRIKG
jgi:hypothetical protein